MKKNLTHNGQKWVYLESRWECVREAGLEGADPPM